MNVIINKNKQPEWGKTVTRKQLQELLCTRKFKEEGRNTRTNEKETLLLLIVILIIINILI